MSHPIREVASGILYWSATHPTMGQEVSSYYLTGQRVLVNPIMPPDGLEWFLTGPPPAAILLTNHHHRRHSREFVERFGIKIHLVREGAELFEDKELPLEPFEFGDTILDGMRTFHIADSWPDETAVEIPDARAVAVADGVITELGGVSFVPDQFFGDPETEKRELADGLRRVAESCDFDHLLISHGPPVLGDGRDQLRAFLSSTSS